MRELTINMTHNEIISNRLFDNICKSTKMFSPLVVKHNTCKSNNICLAYQPKFQSQIVEIVLNEIANVIANEYKYEFLSKSIYQFTDNNSSFNKLILALVSFDSETDKSIVKQSIIVDNYVAVDSYFYFRLNELKQRWADIAQIINNNIESMLLNNSLEEIIGFFSNKKGECVLEIFCEKTAIRLSINGKIDDLCFYKCDDDFSRVATEIISLCPDKILFHGTKNDYLKLKTLLPDEYKIKFFE